MISVYRNGERGQALILLVLGVVILLGFTALAVDGGMLYADRRQAQTGADSASLTGGAAAAMDLENGSVTYMNWNCSSAGITSARQAAAFAAINRAGSNSYTIDQDISDDNGVDTSCGQEDNGSYVDKYLDIRTRITEDTPTAFAHFVYSGPLRSTVEAITRIRPRMPLAYGNAIIALSDVCHGNEGGVTVDGNSLVRVFGGGIFSNACIVGNGSVDVEVTNGTIRCYGANCFTGHGGASFSPTPEENAPYRLPASSVAVTEPDCYAPGMVDRSLSGNPTSIQPGRYSQQIRVNNNETLHMEPGLYCLANGVRVNGNGTLTGDWVTLYITSGDFDTNGNATVTLSSPPARNCTVCPPAIEGVLVYLAEGNDGKVYVTGNSYSTYTGTVYAPNGTIEAGGTADSFNFHSQLISWTVKMHGTSDVYVYFDEELNHQIPSLLELFK